MFFFFFLLDNDATLLLSEPTVFDKLPEAFLHYSVAKIVIYNVSTMQIQLGMQNVLLH